MGKGKGEDKGMTGSSYLGFYDRELDEDPEEPLNFEEQFILRVPRDIAEGRDGKEGLKELVKGKGKGLEGIEFKFFGEPVHSHTQVSKLIARLPPSRLQDQRGDLRVEAGRLAQYHRIAKDVR